MQQSQKRICILGGNGFVGRHLVGRLAMAGWQITLPLRRPLSARELLPAGHISSVPLTAEELERQLPGCHAVVNLVGILNEQRPGEFEQAHVQMPQDLLRACHKAGVPLLLQMSALNADPEAPSEYLRSKGRGEQVIREQSGEALQWAILRPSLIFGPDDSLFNRFASLLRLPGPLPLACPNARFTPIYVGDVAQAFQTLLEQPNMRQRSYQLCGPRLFSLQQLVTYTAELLGRHKRIIPLSPGLSRLQARVLERLPGKPFSYDNYLSLQLDSICQRDGLAELGIEATPVEAIMPFQLQHKGERLRYRTLRRAGR